MLEYMEDIFAMPGRAHDFGQEKRNKGKRRTLTSNNNMLTWFSKPSQAEEVKDSKYVTLHCKHIVGSVS